MNRTAFWLFVEAPRWVVGGGLLGVVAVVVAAAGTVVGPLSGDPVETLFQALVGATITGVTLVVTLNQVVLSQELGAVGDQRDRMSTATEFRRDAESVLDGVAPTDPATFLAELLGAVESRLVSARAAAGGGVSDGDPAEQSEDAAVATLAEQTTESVQGVRRRLEGAESGGFAVTRAALDFDYSRRIDETRRVRSAHGLSDGVDESLAEVVEVLEMYGVAREHVKTLYFQQALIGLSRSIVLATVPALVVGITALLYFRPGPDPVMSVVLGVAVSVTLAPFAVLVAYVVRIATVTGRTLAIGPFILRDRHGET